MTRRITWLQRLLRTGWNLGVVLLFACHLIYATFSDDSGQG
jgi:hypothetical protein